MEFPQINLRKALIIGGFVILVLAMAILLYLFFFRGTPTTPQPDGVATTTPDGTGGLPGTLPDGGDRPVVDTLEPGELPDAVARGGITQTDRITTNQIKNVSTTGNIVSYYDAYTGQFYTIDSNGSIRTLSDKKFANVDSVAWSGTGDKAILEFPDGANIFYNFKTNEQITLPRHWTEFEYAPSGDQILFKSIALEPENNYLSIANERGEGAKVIASLGKNADKVLPDWSPNDQILASYAEGSDSDKQSVFFIGKNDENYKDLVINGINYDSIWNPNGTQLLYNVTSRETNNNPSLWIVNAQGDAIGSGRRPLNLPTTVDKCVFQDTRTLYCAVPQYLPEGSGLIPALANGIPDDIYKVDVLTGKSSLLAILDIPIPITSLTLSSDNRYLYFLDEQTGVLRQLRLR